MGNYQIFGKKQGERPEPKPTPHWLMCLELSKILGEENVALDKREDPEFSSCYVTGLPDSGDGILTTRNEAGFQGTTARKITLENKDDLIQMAKRHNAPLTKSVSTHDYDLEKVSDLDVAYYTTFGSANYWASEPLEDYLRRAKRYREEQAARR